MDRRRQPLIHLSLYRLIDSRRILVRRRERELAAPAAAIAMMAICELQRGQAPTD
jgi:hypothetical protein